jgi:hypothetical protein
MDSDHLQNMPPASRAEKLRCCNLQKWKGVVFLIVSGGVPHTIPRIQLAMNCQQFQEDPILLSVVYLVQLDASSGAFWHFTEALDGFWSLFSPQMANNLVPSARELG